MNSILKKLVKRNLREFGFQINSIPTIGKFLSTRKITTVIDVGANIGQFGSELREQGYKGKIVSFEPINSVFRQLAIRAERDANWRVRNIALGDFNGDGTIKVSENTVFSSILNQSTLAEEFDVDARVAREESIKIETLDSFYTKEFANETVFLKIDTQGFEQNVLSGASNALRNVVGVQLELPIKHLYKGTWNFEDALIWMRVRGFVPAQIRQVNPVQNDLAAALEFDCIFRREL